MFQNAVDIANRGMQHIGAPRISNVLGFNEDSVQAGECAFVYDKLRRAELRRNVWRFATRLCVLRPYTSTTMEIAASLWSSTTIYFIGSLVSDLLGMTWQSLVADNVNNAPGGSTTWEQYFGPLSCDQYSASTEYYAGDVVYVSPGDGSFQVFISTMQSNNVSPTLPAVWLATNTYWKDQVVMVFPAWASGTTYAAGNTVIDSTGALWTSIVNGNVGNTPSLNSSFWSVYPPPVQYPIGSNVYPTSQYLYPPTGGGQPLVFNSQTSTSGIGEWSSTNSYTAGNLVDYKEVQYVAIGNAANLNRVPPAIAAFWAPITNGVPYQSLVDLNSNQPPATSPTAWSTTLTETATTGPAWLEIPNIYMASPFLDYPLGSGPLEQSATRNVFRLPANFLREAPQDPKAGSASYLGSPSGLQYNDWEYQGNYIISRTPFPIVYRFVADVSLVNTFDDLFCEGLGAAIGKATCKRITQSDSGVQVANAEYARAMTEARAVNGIETGATEPAEDDFVSCRI